MKGKGILIAVVSIIVLMLAVVFGVRGCQNDVMFPSSKFNYKMHTDYISREKHFDDRWTFRVIRPTFDGIIFTEIADGNISDGTPFYVGYESIDSLVEHLTNSHAVMIFWIIWPVVIIAALIGFFYIDNSYLE